MWVSNPLFDHLYREWGSSSSFWAPPPPLFSCLVVCRGRGPRSLQPALRSSVVDVFTVEAPQFWIRASRRHRLGTREREDWILCVAGKPVKNEASTMKIFGCRFWLLALWAALLVSLQSVEADLCPSVCTCANDGAIVDCSRQGLTRIPSNLPRNTVTL